MSREQHVVYRMRDATGRLLYVGITLNPLARMNQHRVSKDWWTNVTRIDLEHFEDEGAMLAAEEHAIRSEAPLHNVIHNRGPDKDLRATGVSTSMRLRNVRMPDQLWNDLVDLAAARDQRVADLVREHLETLVRRNRRVIDERRRGHDGTTGG